MTLRPHGGAGQLDGRMDGWRVVGPSHLCNPPSIPKTILRPEALGLQSFSPARDKEREHTARGGLARGERASPSTRTPHAHHSRCVQGRRSLFSLHPRLDLCCSASLHTLPHAQKRLPQPLTDRCHFLKGNEAVYPQQQSEWQLSAEQAPERGCSPLRWRQLSGHRLPSTVSVLHTHRPVTLLTLAMRMVSQEGTPGPDAGRVLGWVDAGSQWA